MPILRSCFVCCLPTLLALLAWVGPARAEVLTADTVWQGEVNLDDDLLIPAGVTLTVKPGTQVRMSAAESTKIDPEYISHQNEILVRGTLRVEATAEAPANFSLGQGDAGAGGETPRWAGIIVDGGVLEASFVGIGGAETGLYLLAGQAKLRGARLADNHYGVIAHGPGAELTLVKSTLAKNDYGLLLFGGAKCVEEELTVAGNNKRDRFAGQAKAAKPTRQELPLGEGTLTHAYTNDTLMGTTVWRGRIRIDGQVRVPADGRLIILPGTVVEFSKRDSNSDGIGENGILIQGVLIAKGTAKQPIHFRSAEKTPGMGDWDAINILGSDQQQNLIEFCQVEQAYRGLHFHFSLVAVTNSVLRQNYRGVQFQESQVELRDSQFYANKSGLQCRDSEVVLLRNQFFDNVNGLNLYRLNLQARENLVANNRWDGLRLREGAAVVEANMLVGNRFGLQVADAVFGRLHGNLLAGNIEHGLALRNTDNIDTSANAILGNGANGVILRDSRGTINGNLIADNGERGLGIQSFVGPISANTILANGLYAIGLDGPGEVEASGNWWGDADLGTAIFDRGDDPTLGVVRYEPKAQAAPLFTWPVAQVPVDLDWRGLLSVPGTVTVPQGAALRVQPGTVVRFAKGAGLAVFGRLEANGEPGRRITFTALEDKGAGSWGEIIMDRAMGSAFVDCDFSLATWALHSHYVDLKVRRCRFANNEGGLRLNSGPVEVSQSLFIGNRIGLRSFRGQATVHDNEFAANEIAIYIREKGSGMRVTGNNIVDSAMYAMRLGDFNDEDVEATGNWWGGKPVLEQVFDGHREEYIGKVRYEPELTAPIDLELRSERGGKP